MKKKLLVVSSSYPLTDGDMNGVFIHELSKRLCSEFEIFVLAPAKKGYSNQQTFEGVQVFRHPQFFWNIDLAYGIGINENLKKNPWFYFVLPFYFLFQLIYIARLVKKLEVPVIYAPWIIPNGFIAVVYKKLFNKNVKVVSTILGSDFWGLNNKIGTWLKKFTIENLDELTVVSQAIKNELVRRGFSKGKHLPSLGVNTEKFNPVLKSETFKKNLEIKGPLLLFVGICVESKGVKLLIQAMPAIVAAFPNCKLLLAGDGNLRNEMEEKIVQLGIESNVKFLGAMPQTKLPELYANADLFILPSYSEGWPVVTMEAMSSGVVCLVSDIPVFKNLDCVGSLLFTFELAKPETLAQQAIELLKNKNPETQKRIREYALENFEWDSVAKKFSVLLKEYY